MAWPAAAARATLLLAHGAGAGQRHPYMTGTAERLSVRGVSVVTFDFAYMERGGKLPDRADALEDCFRAAFEATRSRTEGPLFVGGKSMGGRIASQCAAKGTIAPKGLVFLGYPLHPPKKPGQRRDRHLPNVQAPMLFVQGSRDPFGTGEEVAPLVAQLTRTAKGTTLLAIDDGDHSHEVPKRAGIPQAQVYEQIADAITAWIGEVG